MLLFSIVFNVVMYIALFFVMHSVKRRTKEIQKQGGLRTALEGKKFELKKWYWPWTDRGLFKIERTGCRYDSYLFKEGQEGIHVESRWIFQQVLFKFCGYCYFYYGFGGSLFYFRLFKKGIQVKNWKKNPLTFSQRNGLKGMKIGRYYLTFLS
jgi:hypothetical protein